MKKYAHHGPAAEGWRITKIKRRKCKNINISIKRFIFCNTKLNPTLNATLRAADIDVTVGPRIFFLSLNNSLCASGPQLKLDIVAQMQFWQFLVQKLHIIHRDPNRPPSFGPKRSYHSRGSQTDLLWSKNVKSFMGRPQPIWQPKNVT